MQTVINTPLHVFNMPQYLEIPLFQRPYVWKEEEQWAPLWDDVRRMAELRLSQPGTQMRHFLGAIVLQAQDVPFGSVATHEVIDGQQRLTTLQLLFDAAAAIFSQLDRPAYTSQLHTFTHNDASFVRQGMPLLKLKHTNKDREAFLEVMDAAPPVEYDSLPHRESLIVKAHSFFATSVAEWLGPPDDPAFAQRAESLVSVLASGLQMVVITLTAEENSQEIFETLNARGTPLTAADLIKNFVFQRLDAEGADTQSAYEKLWPFDTKFWEAEESVGRYNVSRSSLFLNQWLVSRTGEEVGLQSTFARFKFFMEHDAHRPMIDVLRDLQEEAGRYQGWHEAARSTDRRLGRTEMCFYRMACLDTHVLKPLLLWLHAPGRTIPEQQVARAINAAESWMMRRAILRLPSSQMGRVVADAIRGLGGVSPEEVAERIENYLSLLKVASTYWPGDDEVRRSLTTEPVYRRFSAKRLRPLLEAVENNMRAQTDGAQVTRWSLAIEHVLPRSWHEHWPLDDEAARTNRDAMVHRLGNLTLLTTKLNSSVSNGAWSIKRAKLQEHDTILLNSRMLASLGTEPWTESAIAARTDLMASQVLEVWPVPAGHTGEVVGGRTRSSSALTVGDLVIARHLAAGTTLRLGRAEFSDVTATVCDNGDIEVDGVRHGSPSGAASVVMRRPTNGWYDWVLEDGRRLDDVRSAYLGKVQATSRAGFEWRRMHMFLEAIPPGFWTTYGELGTALDTAPQPVANHISSCDRCVNQHRVLQSNGQIAPGFTWTDPADERDPRAMLEDEGLSFNGRSADPQRRLGAEDLLGLAPDAAPLAEGTGFFRVSLGRGAAHLDDALERGYIGTGWMAEMDLTPYVGRSVREWHGELNAVVKQVSDIDSDIAAGLAVGQTWLVVEQLRNGDNVLVPTGDGSYRVGIVAGPYYFESGTGLPHRRPVDWRKGELRRDDMSEALRRSLQFQGTAQNLEKYAEELRDLIAALGD
jgi:alkylated DNA nucleotide flippase Atl1